MYTIIIYKPVNLHRLFTEDFIKNITMMLKGPALGIDFVVPEFIEKLWQLFL
mgnify:FL=1